MDAFNNAQSTSTVTSGVLRSFMPSWMSGSIGLLIVVICTVMVKYRHEILAVLNLSTKESKKTKKEKKKAEKKFEKKLEKIIDKRFKKLIKKYID